MKPFCVCRCLFFAVGVYCCVLLLWCLLVVERWMLFVVCSFDCCVLIVVCRLFVVACCLPV